MPQLKPGQARMTQLMAGRVLQPGPAAGAGQDLIQPFRRQRHAAPRPLQHHEHPVRARRPGPLVAQVAAERLEEPVRHRHDPVMAALALHHGQPAVADLHIFEPQSQHLAPAQPGQQHRQHHRPVPVRTQRGDQPVRLLRRQDPRQGPRHPDQRHRPRPVRPARPPGQQAAWHRVDLHRRIPPGDQVGIKARHRRQAARDRPRRQPRLPVRQPHHRPVAALMRQELEHIRRGDLDRGLPGHREERLQVERHRPQRVRPAPARHELQIPVHQPLAQPVTDLARARHKTHKTREAAHFSTIPASDTRTRERHGSPVY
jgi:hypothetical protein